MRFSTHDWTAPLPASEVNSLLREVWADVKTPGDGTIYTVGTVDVNEVQAGTLFSGSPASRASNLLRFFSRSPGQFRQVVMLQATTASTQAIAWQRFYYGDSGLNVIDRPSNARGVSVWPAASAEDTRVVICGETFDDKLVSNPQWPLANGSNASGFIAVFDGAGTFLWDHQFFGAIQDADCAVTDISIRVEFEGGVAVRDVVTYCGISSHGNPANNLTLSTSNAFVAPALLCPTSAIGNTDNGPGQWDGFVGRIVRAHSGAAPTTTRFHAVVGGNQQDGLFGLDELPQERFVVVGSTAGGRTGVPAPNAGSTSTFPLTSGTCLPQAPTAPGYCLATLLYFDATPTASGGSLILERAIEFGTQGADSTIARDVHGQAAPNLLTGDGAFVVGSTTDPQLFASVITGPLSAYGGGVDGFALCVGPLSGGPHVVSFSTFRGGSGDEGLSGVNAWNEFADHVVVAGVAPNPTIGATDTDFDVASFYGDTGGGVVPTVGLRPLTSVSVGGASADVPTAMGAQEVTAGSSSRLAFATFNLGNPAGGGVAQDRDGRVNVAGTTQSPDFPVVFGRARRLANDPQDALRAVFDLLPATVGRTDATGPLPPSLGFFTPPPFTDGGTTPPCALLPFGNQIGQPAPPLQRMLIDYDGAVPGPGATGNIIVTRPPSNMTGNVAVLQFGFPGTPGTFTPLLAVDGIEIWTPLAAFIVPHVVIPNSAYRSQNLVFPPAPFACTVQCFYGVSGTIPSGNPAALMPCSPSNPPTSFAATPALWLAY